MPSANELLNCIVDPKNLYYIFQIHYLFTKLNLLSSNKLCSYCAMTIQLSIKILITLICKYVSILESQKPYICQIKFIQKDSPKTPQLDINIWRSLWVINKRFSRYSVTKEFWLSIESFSWWLYRPFPIRSFIAKFCINDKLISIRRNN